jgi:hypothetical protein
MSAAVADLELVTSLSTRLLDVYPNIYEMTYEDVSVLIHPT